MDMQISKTGELLSTTRTVVDTYISKIGKRLEEETWHIRSDIPEAQEHIVDLTGQADKYEHYKIIDDEVFAVRNLLGIVYVSE